MGFGASFAQAESVGAQADSLDNAKQQAQSYIAETDGIAVIVDYGTGNDIAPDLVGSEFVEVINRRDVPGQSFTYYSHDPGIRISYAFDDIVLGPMSFKTAQYNIDNRVIRAKAAERVARISLGEKTRSSLKAMQKANKYSFETGGIAVLIRYGTGNGVTADEIGTSFVNEIKRRGWEARYFYYDADWKGVTVEYHIKHSAMGPWDSNTAAANVSKAIARAKAAHRVHNDPDALLKCADAPNVKACIEAIKK